jgi:hypothetical protein
MFDLAPGVLHLIDEGEEHWSEMFAIVTRRSRIEPPKKPRDRSVSSRSIE